MGLARVGSTNQRIVCGTMEELLSHDLGPPLHSLVIPGHLHFLEKDMLRMFALNPSVLDERWRIKNLTRKAVFMELYQIQFFSNYLSHVEKEILHKCEIKKNVLKSRFRRKHSTLFNLIVEKWKKENWKKLNGNKSATLTTCVTKEAGAHNPERARLVTAFSHIMLLRTILGRILNIF